MSVHARPRWGGRDRSRAGGGPCTARPRPCHRARGLASAQAVAYGPTPAGEGIAFCTMLLESELANVADKAHALQVRALFHAMQANFDEARASSERAWALIEEFGLTLLKGLFSIDIGLAEALTGDLDRAERELRRGHDLLVAIGDRGTRSSVGAILADVLHRQGRDDEALELATATRAISGADDLDRSAAMESSHSASPGASRRARRGRGARARSAGARRADGLRRPEGGRPRRAQRGARRDRAGRGGDGCCRACDRPPRAEGERRLGRPVALGAERPSRHGATRLIAVAGRC